MKTNIAPLVAAAWIGSLALYAVVSPNPAPGQSLGVSVAVNSSDYGYQINSASDFYEPLDAYGRWTTIGSYGRCWIPGRVEANWRPYSNGHWQQTDAGMYWATDEPWGWATYHYGRWNHSSRYGWFWVPRTEWAPSWVSWREGGGYVGWAALSSNARYERGRYWDDDDHDRRFVFVEQRRFHEPVRSNTVVVNNTVINNTVVNRGPDIARIERETGRKFSKTSVRELRVRDESAVVARHKGSDSGKDRGAKVSDPSKIGPARDGRDGSQDLREQSGKGRAAPEQGGSKDRERATQVKDNRDQPGTKRQGPPAARQTQVAPPQRQKEQASPADRDRKGDSIQSIQQRQPVVTQKSPKRRVEQQPSPQRRVEQPASPQRPQKAQQASKPSSKEAQASKGKSKGAPAAQGKSKQKSAEQTEEEIQQAAQRAKRGKGR